MILKSKDNSNNNQDNNDMLIKYEFEQLLKYKQNQLNSTTNASKILLIYLQ